MAKENLLHDIFAMQRPVSYKMRINEYVHDFHVGKQKHLGFFKCFLMYVRIFRFLSVWEKFILTRSRSKVVVAWKLFIWAITQLMIWHMVERVFFFHIAHRPITYDVRASCLLFLSLMSTGYLSSGAHNDQQNSYNNEYKKKRRILNKRTYRLK